MGGTTVGGVPYPVGTDFVVDGDNAMQTMAEAFDQDPPEIQAIRNAAGSCNSNAWSKLQWSGAGYQNNIGSALSLSPSGVTCVLAGRYSCELVVGWAANAAGGRRGIGILLTTETNPSTFNQVVTGNPSATSWWMRGTFSCTLAANAVLTGCVFQDSGAAMTIPADYTSLTVRRVRPGQKHS